jgi:hypothetical protein
MNPERGPSPTAADPIHDQARSFAAEAIDADLQPVDAAWLAEHLAACPECSAIADEYRALHLELRSLLAPEPPRDLWARTSAALDAADRRAPAKKRNRPSGSRAGSRPLFGTAIAVGFVVLVAGASLLAQSPIVSLVPGSTPAGPVAVGTGAPAPASHVPLAPLAVVRGTTYWIASDQGLYEIRGGSTDCGQTTGSCTVTGGSGQTLGSITSDTTVSAALAPDASQAAVWTADKIAIVPLATTPQTVSLDLLTPRPTQVATATPAATASAPAITSTPAVSPAISPVATISISLPSVASPTPTAAPAASATGGAVVTKPTAILDGYEVVGRDPEFSADGSLVAFSARPVDHSTGPNVFIWRSGQEQARAVTSPHNADLFAGWMGGKILVNEISAATATGSATAGSNMIGTTSFLFDPATGDTEKIDRPMLVAGVDPTGQSLVYWSGSVEFDPASGLWQPGKGDLYYDTWADLKLEPASFGPEPAASPGSTATVSAAPSLAPSPSPSPTAAPSSAATAAPSMLPETKGSPEPTAPAASPTNSPEPTQSALPQRLSVAGMPASVQRWTVRWDTAGQNVAVWVADPGGLKIGRLSLFTIDRTSGLLNPTLAADAVLSTIQFDDSKVVYTSAMDGNTYMKAVPIIPPSSVSTPAPATPGGAPPSAGSSGVPALATDRPGG